MEVETVLKIKMPDKLRAIEIDSKLAGDLEPNEGNQQEIGRITQFVVNLINQPQPPGATPITIEI